MELGGGVHHNVRAVFDGADQIGRAEGVVDHQRDLMGMCVAHNAVMSKELDPLNRMLLLPFSLFCSKKAKSNLYLFNASRLWYT